MIAPRTTPNSGKLDALVRRVPLPLSQRIEHDVFWYAFSVERFEAAALERARMDEVHESRASRRVGLVLHHGDSSDAADRVLTQGSEDRALDDEVQDHEGQRESREGNHPSEDHGAGAVVSGAGVSEHDASVPECSPWVSAHCEWCPAGAPCERINY